MKATSYRRMLVYDGKNLFRDGSLPTLANDFATEFAAGPLGHRPALVMEKIVPHRDRRSGPRIALEIFLNQYVRDRLVRGLTQNISPAGLYLQTARSPRSCLPQVDAVALEFELPGTGEVIWARGELCHQARDHFALGAGIRFAGMAQAHAQLIRDYCCAAERL